MADQRTDLPEGTDSVIDTGLIADNTGGPDQGGQTITKEDTTLVAQKEIPAPDGLAEKPVTGSGSPKGGLAERSGGSSSSGGSSGSITDRLRSSGEQLTSQAGEKARGLVGQGLERTSEALGNVARMVGDTAPGIEERLGTEYGDYARRAAGAIENAANSLAEKNPDELIDDTRNFVRSSPGVALAGAAVVGFVIARLLKTGLGRDDDDSEDQRD